MPRFFDLNVRYRARAKDWKELGYAGVLVFPDEAHIAHISKMPKSGFIAVSEKHEILRSCVRKFRVICNQNYILDRALVRSVATYKRAFEIPIDMLLSTCGVERAVLISKMRSFLNLCNKFGADFALTSRARSKCDMRSPSEMVSIGYLLGLTREQSIRAISTVPERIIKESKGFLWQGRKH
ncbi:MAG: RNase P subunit p30 family protein [Candidatus Micrarchaeia archaeon]